MAECEGAGKKTMLGANSLRLIYYLNDCKMKMNVNFAVITSSLSLLLYSNLLYSQDTDTEFQSWSDITAYFFISARSAIGGDAGLRGVASARDWSQIYFRPSYRFQYNNLDLSAGVAYFHTYNKGLSNVGEWRLFQQATVHWPSTHLVKFNHRLRLEQRFLSYKDPAEGEPDDDFSSRIRYQFLIRSRDLKVFKQSVYLKAAIEFFQRNNTGDEAFINRNRFILAVGHRLPGKWWYEIHYMAQRSRQFEDDGLKTSEHVLRIRLFRSAIYKQRIE